MKTANLLIDCDSLIFTPPDTDLTESLEDFFLAHGKAREYKDKVYNSPEIWDKNYSASDNIYGLIELLSNYRNAKIVFPWLSLTLQQSFTQKLLWYSTTKKNAKNLQELEAEFINENNGILGVGGDDITKRVFDILSWYKLHSAYLKQHPEFINWETNSVLPLVQYSNLRLLELVDIANAELNTEQEKLEFFRNDFIRTFRRDRGELVNLATEIAIRNCYQKDAQLSSMEGQQRSSQRLIFKVNKAETLQYISLDFENGQWEVCNENGEHIGVYNFSGEKTANADGTGNHDILALRN